MKFPLPTPSISLLLLALVLVPPARGLAEPVALHPCAVTGTKLKAQLEELQTLCVEEVVRSGMQLVPSSEVSGFLDEQPKRTCALAKDEARNACLGRLAEGTQAASALFITVTPGPLVLVSGLTVSAQGEVVDRKSIQLRNRGDGMAEVVQLAVRRMLGQIQISPGKLAVPVEQLASKPAPDPTATPTEPTAAEEVTQPADPTASADGARPADPTASADGAKPADVPAAEAQAQAQAVAQPPPPEVEPAPAEVSPAFSLPAPQSPAPNWRTPARYASLGAGVVGAGLAVLFAVQAQGNMARATEGFNAAAQGQPNGVPVFASEAELQEKVVQYHDAARGQRVLAGVSAGLGAALLGAGAWLWLSELPQPQAGTASLLVGPGAVTLRVLTP